MVSPFRRLSSRVPLYLDGSLVHRPWESFPRSWRGGDTDEEVGLWAEPFEFNALLQFNHFDRELNHTVAYWTDVLAGGMKQYPMLLPELSKVLRRCEFQTGNIVDGRWGFVKSNDSYGITPVFPEELE